MKLFRTASICLIVLTTGCTAIQDENGEPPDDVLYAAGEQVSRCNFKSHMQCIYLTAAETIIDGQQVKWTRHWFRMSYIGRACEAQYGKTTGVAVETLFAIPHYLGIAVGNTLSILFYPLEPFGQDEKPAGETIGTEPTPLPALENNRSPDGL